MSETYRSDPETGCGWMIIAGVLAVAIILLALYLVFK